MMGEKSEDLIEHEMVPIGMVDGMPVFPIFGAEPEDDDEDDADDDAEDGDDDDEDDDPEDDEDDDEDDEDDKSKKSKKKAKSDDEDDDSEVALWKGRANTYKRRMQAADERANTAERENRRLKRSKTDALDEPGKQDLQETKNSLTASQQKVSDLTLQVALLSDGQFQWQDPSLVLRALADSDDVEIDEDGKVSGVKQALKRLAKDKPFLVKKSDKSKASQDGEDDEEDEDEEKPARGSKTGTRTRRRTASAPDRKALQARYSALNRR